MPVPQVVVKDKPIVIHSKKIGENYMVYTVVVPGGDIVMVPVHNINTEKVSINEKTNEITLPAESAFNMMPTPEGYPAMGFKGIIGLWGPRKAK